MFFPVRDVPSCVLCFLLYFQYIFIRPLSPPSILCAIFCRSQSNRGVGQLHTNAVLEFEERLEAIRIGLSQGVDVIVWEGK